MQCHLHLGAASFPHARACSQPAAPTSAEIYEYCRDPESSGCDVDMLDAMAVYSQKMAKPGELRQGEARLCMLANLLALKKEE